MNIFRHILSIALVVLILFAGVPQFCPEDADRNRRIDLKDAIQQVMDVAQSADDQENFTGTLGRAISTLNVLAGIKTVIKTDSQTQHSATGNFLNTPFLLSKIFKININTHFIKIVPVILSYHCIDLTVDSPPSQGNISIRMLIPGFFRGVRI